MKKFDKIYKNILSDNIKIKESHIENDFKKIYETLLNEWDIISKDSLSPEDLTMFESSLNTLWNKEIGITPKGAQFIKDRQMFLTESSSENHRKNYIKTTLNSKLKELFENSKLKDSIYSTINDVYTQTNSSCIKDAISYDILESAIIEEVNKEVKKYFEPILEELKNNY